MTAEVIIQTETGERIASYRGLSRELVERVLRFLDLTLGSAKTLGDIKRTFEGLAAVVEGMRKR